jgi:hypothetical protein
MGFFRTKKMRKISGARTQNNYGTGRYAVLVIA